MVIFSDGGSAVQVYQLNGFCADWKFPLSPEKLLQILQNSYVVELALDDQTNQVVGFVNALSDQVHFAFIAMLEVLPSYQHQGIATELMKRILAKLEVITCIDLTCSPSMQSFYERVDMLPSTGMIIRRYLSIAHQE